MKKIILLIPAIIRAISILTKESISIRIDNIRYHRSVMKDSKKKVLNNK
jgi:hypothetical protein